MNIRSLAIDLPVTDLSLAGASTADLLPVCNEMEPVDGILKIAPDAGCAASVL